MQSGGGEPRSAGQGAGWLSGARGGSEPLPASRAVWAPLQGPCRHTLLFSLASVREKSQKGSVWAAWSIVATVEERLLQRGIAAMLSLLLRLLLLNVRSCQPSSCAEPWNSAWACAHTCVHAAFCLTDALFLMLERLCTAAALSFFYHITLYFDCIFLKCLLSTGIKTFLNIFS